MHFFYQPNNILKEKHQGCNIHQQIQTRRKNTEKEKNKEEKCC
jgi:hypothetical protein